MNISWMSATQAKDDLPQEQFNILIDRHSLTARIRNQCQGKFEVQLIRHQTVAPSTSEARLLRLNEQEQAISRQVYLNCDGAPQIYAKTIVGLTPENKHLTDKITTLGEQSLGSLLFRDPLAEKIQIHLAKIDADHAFLCDLELPSHIISNEVWVRRSLYEYEGCKLIVYEAFLYL